MVRGSPSGLPLRYPPWPPGSTQPLGMGLSGLGLLSDSLGKILCRTGGTTPWRPSHPRKPHLAPGPQVPRSAEGPTLLQLPRSVPGRAGKEEEVSYPVHSARCGGWAGLETEGLVLLGGVSLGKLVSELQW